MASVWDGLFRRVRRRGRPAEEPKRASLAWPNLATLGQATPQANRVVYKPVPRNLRYFSRTPLARRAINAIRNPLMQIKWEVVPRPGIALNSELKRQIEIATTCLSLPNDDDDFTTLMMQLVEDICCGAGCLEIAKSSLDWRPVWLFPVDGLSIHIFPAWTGQQDQPRYLQTVGYGSYSVGAAQGVRLRDDELIYIRPNPNTASPFGFGPLEIAFNTIAKQLATAEFAGKLAGNALPPFMLDLGEVTSRTVQTWRSYWTNEVEGEGKIPIIGTELLDDGFSGTGRTRGVNAIKLYPEGDKALYLQYQEFLRTEIAAAFDLCNMSLNLERDVNRSTAEVAEEREWVQAVRPMARMISGQLTRKFLWTALGFSQLQFVFVGVEREDVERTANVNGKYYTMNVLTPNEIRKKIGEPPLANYWADKVKADVDVALSAAKGVGIIDDPNLEIDGQRPPVKPAAPSGGNKVAASSDEEDTD